MNKDSWSADEVSQRFLEVQAQLLMSDARIRALRSQLAELLRLLNIPPAAPFPTLEDAFRHSVQAELQAQLARIADGDPANASALTKLLLSGGFLKQTNDESSSNS